MRIEACFDSHVHWAAVGEFSTRLHLEGLTSAQAIETLKVERIHRRGDWILGFGWDETGWPDKPHRSHLDARFPDVPVAFSRCDAHALWVNTAALKLSGLWEAHVDLPGGRLELDADGRPSGILVDQASAAVEKLIPRQTNLEIRRHLLHAVKIFNEAGYTHIRDMTCDEMQWSEALKLDDSGLLTLAVEEYFWLKEITQLPSVLSLALAARTAQTSNLRVKGLKVFIDGALGSEGAWLSRCYHGSQADGLKLWEEQNLREVFIRAWEKGLDVAVHAIGDKAASWTVQIALQLKQEGHVGGLHLEHAELLRPETIRDMQGLNVQCHLQPAQWLGDRRWLQEKLGDLAEFAFPWRRLQEADIPFDFGSDAPIDQVDMAKIFSGLRKSADAGVPRLLGSPTTYMSHRDLSWAPNSYTLVEEEMPTQVIFRGEHLI